MTRKKKQPTRPSILDYLPVHARLFIARTSDIDGAQRCMVGGTILDNPLEYEDGEVWDGEIILTPRRRIAVGSGRRGWRIDQCMTSAWFAKPELLLDPDKGGDGWIIE